VQLRLNHAYSCVGQMDSRLRLSPFRDGNDSGCDRARDFRFGDIDVFRFAAVRSAALIDGEKIPLPQGNSRAPSGSGIAGMKHGCGSWHGLLAIRVGMR
jgi:hypothetical protein